MRNFRTFDLAVEFYRQCRTLPIKGVLRTQLDRASSSIALNLAEGRGKSSVKDQLRFFDIAMGSLRECQGILILADLNKSKVWQQGVRLGGTIFKLIRANR